MTSIKRLFIANRGEIARRIALTASRLGIETVVLTERENPPDYLSGIVTHFVKVAEESPALFLNAEAMIGFAKDTRCDSIHPGFGFLSENAEFAEATEKAGLLWIGPNPGAILAMASKATARAKALAAQVPCIRGISDVPIPTDENGDFSVLEGFAKEAGFPLLLKAAYGGGGKGMRIVDDMNSIRSLALRASSEAKNSFGNGALICEQYLRTPRHVEVQILSDKHGNVYAIGDRDCSIQRRHQKIIEEAPAPDLSPVTREKIHAAAVALAKAVGYDSTGTVEFLVDWQPNASTLPEQKFYFLEMNTRLQVEHPVTEEVFGMDLVEWQIKVAQGEKLPSTFGSLMPRGHSFEVRIYAEDPENDFFPAPGAVALFKPAIGPGIRWETGLDEVDEVTGKFDPMIAKLVVKHETRQGAINALVDALKRTVLHGPANNIPLLIAFTKNTSFYDGPLTTKDLGDLLKDVLNNISDERKKLLPISEKLLNDLSQYVPKHLTPLSVNPEALTSLAFQTSGGAAILHDSALKLSLSSLKSTHSTPTLPSRTHGVTTHSGTTVIEGRPITFAFSKLSTPDESTCWVSMQGHSFQRKILHESARRSTQSSSSANDSSIEVLAPVPGKVIAVKASEGQNISEGDVLIVLESMKMEFEVKASRNGTLGSIKIKSGDQVTRGATLAVWHDP